MSVPPTAIAYNVGSARTTAPTSMDEFFGRSSVGADRYLGPERVHDGPQWPGLLRGLLIPRA